jgi:hypothetical protein
MANMYEVFLSKQHINQEESFEAVPAGQQYCRVMFVAPPWKNKCRLILLGEIAYDNRTCLG